MPKLDVFQLLKEVPWMWPRQTKKRSGVPEKRQLPSPAGSIKKATNVARRQEKRGGQRAQENEVRQALPAHPGGAEVKAAGSRIMGDERPKRGGQEAQAAGAALEAAGVPPRALIGKTKARGPS